MHPPDERASREERVSLVEDQELQPGPVKKLLVRLPCEEQLDLLDVREQDPGLLARGPHLVAGKPGVQLLFPLLCGGRVSDRPDPGTPALDLSVSHEIPAMLPATAPAGKRIPVNDGEVRLRGLLLKAGFPEAEWQHHIELGRPLGSTTPDCFFAGEDPRDPGVCVYLDGLSDHIHGNAATAGRDRAIRKELKARGYDVFEIAATELWDRDGMARHFFKLGRVLLGRDRARELRDQPDWFPEAATEAAARPVEQAAPAAETRRRLAFRAVAGEASARFKTCVPLLSLRAAAGSFGESQLVEPEAWVEPITTRRLRPGMFVAQVVGRSMEPAIPDGAYCLFAGPVEGSRNGRIVLVQLRDIQDPETGERYTVKRYRSERERDGAGSWRHTEVRLEPENREFAPIILRNVPEGEIKILGEVIAVLPST